MENLLLQLHHPSEGFLHLVSHTWPLRPIGYCLWKSQIYLLNRYALLSTTGNVNSVSLSVLEHCLFVVCLDEGTRTVPSYSTIRKDSTTLELTTMAGHVLHGSGTDAGTANRWYDKFLQVTAATMAGYQYLSEFERGVIVGAQEMGHGISEVAMKFGFSRTTISRVYRAYRESGKT
ncbi:uncharacterized protein TNCV_4153321 [Trichonephila clavipes]|nr:uncharacterized protein TNCV_4153321 [Trichonephila clavipes]